MILLMRCWHIAHISVCLLVGHHSFCCMEKKHAYEKSYAILYQKISACHFVCPIKMICRQLLEKSRVTFFTRVHTHNPLTRGRSSTQMARPTTWSFCPCHWQYQIGMTGAQRIGKPCTCPLPCFAFMPPNRTFLIAKSSGPREDRTPFL